MNGMSVFCTCVEIFFSYRVPLRTRTSKERIVRRIQLHALSAWVGMAARTASWTGCSTCGWRLFGRISKRTGEWMQIYGITLESANMVFNVSVFLTAPRRLASPRLPSRGTVHGRYTDLKKIKQQGLKASDLEKLDIKNPLQRR